MTEREEFEAWWNANTTWPVASKNLALLAWQTARRTTPDREAIIAALREIAEQDPIEMALDPTWAKRIATEALKTAPNGEKG